LASGLALLASRLTGRTALGFFEVFEEPKPPEGYEEYDWKEEAYKRQQERIAWRTKKANPNYKETIEEMRKRRQKEAAWDAVQRRGTESVVGSAFTDLKIVVELEKPLGIEFTARKGGGVFIEQIQDGFPAKMIRPKIAPGDILISVNDVDVAGLPFDEAIQPIVDAPGIVALTFVRPLEE